MLLFGGSSKIGTAGGFFGDTWIWNGTTWTRLTPAAAPPGRAYASMTYDSATRQRGHLPDQHLGLDRQQLAHAHLT
jgi:hypothetical protein